MAHLLSLVFLFAALVVASPTAVAYEPVLNTTTIPYEPFLIDSDIVAKSEYLGELTGDPHMYEFTIGADTTLTLKLAQLPADTPVPFSLIAVRQNLQNAGVVEVGRQRAQDISWTKEGYSSLGFSLLESPVFTADIGPGTYRVEVSTPENMGKYMLVVGTEEVSRGYFRTLGDIRTIQAFFDKSFFRIFLSSYVYYPLGSMLLIYGMYVTWRNRQKISHAA